MGGESMKTLEEWMQAYGVSHQNKTNVIIHKICVPLIMMSLLGLIWSIPFPFSEVVFVNWATIFIALCCVFYATLSLKVLVFMIVQSFAMLAVVYYVSQTSYLIHISVAVFILAWVGQFIGHKIEGAKPSFFEDLQFLLIGPVWIYPFFK